MVDEADDESETMSDEEIDALARMIEDEGKPFAHFTVPRAEYIADPRAVSERSDREQANFSVLDDETGKPRMHVTNFTRARPYWEDDGPRLLATVQKFRAQLRAADAMAQSYAAVSLVEDPDGRVLCVWNARYRGWSLPGGKVETGETAEQAQERELREETGCGTRSRRLVFDGEHGIKAAIERGRASRVKVFRVVVEGEPRQMEEGCPVCWKTRQEFLAESPFAPLYTTVFAQVPAPHQAYCAILPLIELAQAIPEQGVLITMVFAVNASRSDVVICKSCQLELERIVEAINR
jgi:ADP-ribose pyrophosphatase YjhB (NUDIX family)